MTDNNNVHRYAAGLLAALLLVCAPLIFVLIGAVLLAWVGLGGI